MAFIEIDIYKHQSLEIFVWFGEELAVGSVDACVAVVDVGRFDGGVFGGGRVGEDAGWREALEGREDVGAGFDRVGGGYDVGIGVGRIGVRVHG